MKRKFSDYVLLVLSIFALIYGSLSLFSIAYSFIQGCLDNELGELFFYSQLPELINLIPTVISLFQGVRLLICFVKKTSDKKANAIISIAYSFAVGILFSFMTNMILTLAFSNGNFGDFLKNLIHSWEIVDLIACLLMWSSISFIFTCSRKKKYVQQVVWSILMVVFWGYLEIRNFIALLQGSSSAPLDYVVEIVLLCMILLFGIYYVFKSIELMNDPNYEEFSEYFKDADYDVIKDDGKRVKLRIFQNRSEEKGKNLLARIILISGLVAFFASAGYYTFLNWGTISSAFKGFEETSDYLDFVFGAVDLSILLILVGMLASYASSFYGLIKGNAKYYAGILTYFGSIRILALPVVFLMVSNVLMGIISGLSFDNYIVYLILLVTYLVGNLLLNAFAKKYLDEVRESDQKKENYYEAAKARRFLFIYYFVGNIFIFALAIYVQLSNIPYVVDYGMFILSTILIFIGSLLDFSHPSNDYEDTSMRKEDFERVQGLVVEQKKEDEKLLEEIHIEKNPEAAEAAQNISLDEEIKKTPHKFLFFILSPEKVFMDPFAYLFSLLGTLVFYFVYAKRNFFGGEASSSQIDNYAHLIGIAVCICVVFIILFSLSQVKAVLLTALSKINPTFYSKMFFFRYLTTAKSQQKSPSKRKEKRLNNLYLEAKEKILEDKKVAQKEKELFLKIENIHKNILGLKTE